VKCLHRAAHAGALGRAGPRAAATAGRNGPTAATGTGGQRPAPPRGWRVRGEDDWGAGTHRSRKRTGKAEGPAERRRFRLPSLRDGGSDGGRGAGAGRAALVAAGRHGGERAPGLPPAPAAAARRGRAALHLAGASPVPAGPPRGGCATFGAWPPARAQGAGAEGDCGARGGRRGRGAQLRLGLSQGVAEGPLFINVCSWKRVPAPKAPTDPTPVSAGPLEEVSGEGGTSRGSRASPRMHFFLQACAAWQRHADSRCDRVVPRPTLGSGWGRQGEDETGLISSGTPNASFLFEKNWRNTKIVHI